MDIDRALARVLTPKADHRELANLIYPGPPSVAATIFRHGKTMARMDRFWIIGLPALALAACGPSDDEVVLAEPGAEPSAPSAGTTEVLPAANVRRGARLSIVGSSTVFPFISAVAENFGVRSGFATPVVEQTGTGGGMNLFCSGLGLNHPDFTAASRRMKPSEFQLCQENGVTDIVEVPIGFDGIILGNSNEAEPMDIAKADLFLALAATTPMPVDETGDPLLAEDGRLLDGASFSQAVGFDCSSFVENPYRRWSDIDPRLPSNRIEVFGPPPTSGTRDAFVELDMVQGARDIACLEDLRSTNRPRFDEISARIREDGSWVDSGENDNAVVQRLDSSPGAFGIFGYSFLEQNGDRIQAARVDGVEPTYENISSGIYPASRSLFIYVKAQHVGLKPGLREFVEELTHEEAWGPFGYLADRGLIALPDTRRSATADQSRALQSMDLPE